MTTTHLVIMGGVLFWLITCWAIIDIARKDFSRPEFKVGWIIFAALVPFIGVLAYLIFGYKKGVPRSKKPADA